MPAPATTTIFFLRRRTLRRRSNWASPASSRLSRSRCSVQRGLRSATLRRFAGGGPPSVRTWISATSTLSCSFSGEALPDWVAIELGEGYRLETFMGDESAGEDWGGREGDRDMTDRGGEEESMDGVAVRSERGEDGMEDEFFFAGVSMVRHRERVATSVEIIGRQVVRDEKYLSLE